MWTFLKKLEIELPYYPEIPLLGIHTEETRIEGDTCTPMFIIALFTIARTSKQPKFPWSEEWIKKMWYIYTMECYSDIKKKARMSFITTWMGPRIVISSEAVKDKYPMTSLICEI